MGMIIAMIVAFCVVLIGTYILLVRRMRRRNPERSALAKFFLRIGYLIVSIFVAFIVMLVIRFALSPIYAPFQVSGVGMSPAYNNGDMLVIKKVNNQYERGDVVVVRTSEASSGFAIVRIVGLPEENMRYVSGELFIDDVLYEESYLSQDSLEATADIEITLNSQEYFVLGDNRPQAIDSRAFGPITRDAFVGKADARAAARQ